MITEPSDAAHTVTVKGEAKAMLGHFIETQNQSHHPMQPHTMASSEPSSTVRESYIALIFVLAGKKQKSVFCTQQSIEVLEAKTCPEALHNPET